MIGSFLTRGLVMVFGYAYPAYECFKSVEKNKPDIEQLRFWCQYWILVAMLTVCERFADLFISWVPMYSEAKLAFYIYLWYPKTKGTTFVYNSFFRPYIAKHETDIDRSLLELRTRAADIAVLHCQKAVSYAQTRVVDILHFVASQSTPKRRPSQPQEGPNLKPMTSSETEEAAVPAPRILAASLHRKVIAEEIIQSPKVSTAASTAAAAGSVTTLKAANAAQTVAETAKSTSTTDDGEEMEIESESSSSSTSENYTSSTNQSPQEITMEDMVRVTRSRLRKTRGATIR